MEKYVCISLRLCNMILLGDPDNGVAPGTPFDKLPEDWVCPIAALPTQFDPA